ncbi:MAG: hypothetical protein GEU28_11410 [Dehalococcoidia bacterium]|nr:hypothetical protein [Dehalococcoidia bacterium]
MISAAGARHSLAQSSLHYASFESRVIAYLLDLVVLLGIFLLLVAICLLPLVLATDSGEEDLPDWAIWTVIPIVPAFILSTMFYFVGFWVGAGQTIGQMITAIRVVRRDGYPVGFSRAFLRYLALSIPTIFVLLAVFTLWASVVLFDLFDSSAGQLLVSIVVFALVAAVGLAGFLMSLFDRERRTLHDLLAGTVVVAS